MPKEYGLQITTHLDYGVTEGMLNGPKAIDDRVLLDIRVQLRRTSAARARQQVKGTHR